MASEPITELDLAVSIDPIQDTFPIVNDALDETQRINRNVFLEITGSPVGTSDAQSIGNKTIGVSNTVSLLDTLFTLNDNTDPTKKAQFQLSGITTSTTRTYTLPNASSTLADLSTAQTFTNKTLTSPAITGGTITNSTISVDSISEFTSGNGVTVDGLNIKDAKLNTNNSVVTANITDSAITPAKLLTGTGSSWAWQSWTPTFTNLTVGNGALSAKYTQVGKVVTARIDLVLGTTSSVSGAVNFTLPVTSVSLPGTATTQTIGDVEFYNAGSTLTRGWVSWVSTTSSQILVNNAAGTYVTQTTLSSTVPYTWANSMEIHLYITYEAA